MRIKRPDRAGRENGAMQNETRVRGRNGVGEGGIPLLFLLKSLLFSYILTAGLLLLLAFVLFKLELSERPVAVAIIVIYVVATFFAGFVTGKKLGNRKFLWGLLMGAAYFVVLALVSLAVRQSPDALGNSFFTTMALCAGGGMLGGMVS
ncbi:MAG: TIGR04086 family membrane protein [Muribaculum sp.]|nr:TIGR04086 family membrane protein [Muribaculum sp.]